MPGMKSGLSATNPIIVAAVKAALLHQGLIIALVLVLVLVALASAAVRSRGVATSAASSPVRLMHP